MIPKLDSDSPDPGYHELKPHPDVSNPVLTAADVTDEDAEFVADPFLFRSSEVGWHLFFETQRRTGHGVIGHATSPDGRRWFYDRTVIDAGWHTAFPYVFRWEGEHYLLPAGGGHMPLFRAATFPTEWEIVTEELVLDRDCYQRGTTDTAIIRWGGAWWLFDNDGNTDLHVYYNHGDLETGTWTRHPENPVVRGNETCSRPCGRFLPRDDHVLAFYMDTTDQYGERVSVHRIETLTETAFSQTELDTSPILDGSLLQRFLFTRPAWCARKMHHYDEWWVPEERRWICAVDGHDGSEWSIGIYAISPSTD
jgi:hypothetical protein